MIDEAKWFFIMIIFVVVFGFGALVLSNYNQSQEMQVCVQSGQSWQHVRGDIYECK